MYGLYKNIIINYTITLKKSCIRAINTVTLKEHNAANLVLSHI